MGTISYVQGKVFVTPPHLNIKDSRVIYADSFWAYKL